jgi:NAD(P)-dependent dehydrogenase (short-subunit alcohol dehydrogenase family)
MLMKDRNCVITGATSGIGRATALVLGAKGANLVLIGRNEQAGHRVAARIRRMPGAGEITFLRADLSAQRQVRDLAASIREQFHRIDVLVNNAGARFDEYGATVDGLERTFATNHLSHFLLACLLLEPLLQSQQGRIISISSSAHHAVRQVNTWMLGPETYDRRQAYGLSKLANVLFSVELARRLQGTGVTANTMDPGGVASNFARNNGLKSWLRHLLAHARHHELVRPVRAGEAIAHLATAGELGTVSGAHFRRTEPTTASPLAQDPQLGRELWRQSLRWTSLDERIGPAWKFISP